MPGQLEPAGVRVRRHPGPRRQAGQFLELFSTNQECLQVLIQQKATMLNLYITAIVTLPTVIAPLILGPWLAHFFKVLRVHENNKLE